MINISALTPVQKKLLVAALSLLVIYIVFGFIGTPLIIRYVLEKKVSEAVDRTIRVESVRFNPFTLSLKLKALDIKEPDGKAFVFLNALHVNLEALSVLKGGLVVKEIRVMNPDIVLVRYKDGRFNFSRMPKEGEAQKEEPNGKKSSSFHFSIAKASISGAAIAISDQVTSVEHKVENLDIDLTDLSAFPKDVKTHTVFKLSGRINGANLTVTGKSLPFDTSMGSTASIQVTGLELPHYTPYVTLPDNMTLLSAAFGLKTDLEFQKTDNEEKILKVSGNLNLAHVQIGNEKGDPILKIPRYDMTMGKSDVLAGNINISSITIDSPELFLTRLSSGQLDLPGGTKGSDQESTEYRQGDTNEKAHPSINLETLSLRNGKIAFTDLSAVETFSTALTGLDLTVNHFSLDKEKKTTVDFIAKTEFDETLSLKGDFSLFPLVLGGKLVLKQVKPVNYQPYYQAYTGSHLDQGEFDLQAGFRVDTGKKDPDIKLSDIDFIARNFRFSEKGSKKQLLDVETLMLKGAADLTGRSIAIDNIALNGGHLSLRRDKTGEINLLKAVSRGTVAKAVAGEGQAAVSQKASDADSWRFLIKKASIDPFDLFIEDLMPLRPVKVDIEKIVLSADTISNRKGLKGHAAIGFTLNKTGIIKIKGPITLTPIEALFDMDVKKLGIRTAQPYLADKTGMIITDGFLDTKGKFSFKLGENSEPDVDYSGTLAINRFSSIDRAKANDFLKWDSLYFEKLDVGTVPNHVVIDKVSLSKFYARVIINKDGTVNLATVIKGNDEKAEKEPVKEAEKKQADKSQTAGTSAFDRIRVNTVTLQGGELNLTDQYVPFGFNANIFDIGGNISGLASIREEKADVSLKGRLENHSPVEITGRINPLIENSFLDLKIAFRDIEMSPLSPYSGRYLGQMLEKGKLTFELEYLLEDRHLKGKNRVFLSQLELGESVDSDDATTLPIGLAVSLLKDREGNIDLNLPVDGMIDDPEFKIGGVLVTMLKNLIVKIVSSPFAALGAMVGGGEELGYLDFQHGSADLDPAGKEKLDKLVKILFERPKLSIEINGNIDIKNDLDGLRKKKFETLLKGEKLKADLKGGSAVKSLETTTIAEGERGKWLAAAYHASDFPKPRDSDGKIKKLTPEEMEKLLITSMEVTDNDLRLLAVERARITKNYILSSGRIEPARVFIIEPGIGRIKESTENKAEPKSRVVFKLK